MSKRTVTPTRRGAAEVRPPSFSPKDYVRALELLEHDPEMPTDSYETLVRCGGRDVEAGQMVEAAMRAGVAPSAMLDILCAVLDDFVRAQMHNINDEQRSRALLLLRYVAIIGELGYDTFEALDVILPEERAKGGILAMAVVPACIALDLAKGQEGASLPDSFDVEVRDLVRITHGFGGDDAVQVVVESLRTKLQRTHKAPRAKGVAR